MPNLGAALNCARRSTQSDRVFFRFRRDPARCQKWVENCRSADLEDKTPDQLNKDYRWCAKHFATSMIYNAIPTIFDLTSHLNNPHSRHRKQIKELSEDEIRTLKQKKIDETSDGFSSKMKIVASRLLEKYPQAIYTICASCAKYVVGKISTCYGSIRCIRNN
uniref:THAP-type domain-containing protein n=1 Tax=Theropithecus gelada TaxID=9565 RepID=A0A8D2ESE4_THEGE